MLLKLLRLVATCLNVMSLNKEIEAKRLEDFESSDSDEDENICRSPAKSPLKLSSVLKRKRNLSDSDLKSQSESDCSESELEANSSLESDEQIVGSSKSGSKLPTDKDFQFKEPQFRKKQFIFHPFKHVSGVFTPDSAPTSSPVVVTIPEQLAASYGLYLWPSSPVLAWYLWLDQERYKNSRVLELGAGTALPGLLLAKLGCSVTLSDSVTLPHCVKNCKEAVRLNSLEDRVQVVPLSWGLVTSKLLKFRNKLDWVIGSDLFFDPEVFESLIVTVKWLLDNNQGCQFLCTVQERSADWSIETLLKKYRLQCSYEYPDTFLRGTGISTADLTGNHNIFVLKIGKSNNS